MRLTLLLTIISHVISRFYCHIHTNEAVIAPSPSLATTRSFLVAFTTTKPSHKPPTSRTSSTIVKFNLRRVPPLNEDFLFKRSIKVNMAFGKAPPRVLKNAPRAAGHSVAASPYSTAADAMAEFNRVQWKGQGPNYDLTDAVLANLERQLFGAMNDYSQFYDKITVPADDETNPKYGQKVIDG